MKFNNSLFFKKKKILCLHTQTCNKQGFRNYACCSFFSSNDAQLFGEVICAKNPELCELHNIVRYFWGEMFNVAKHVKESCFAAKQIEAGRSFLFQAVIGYISTNHGAYHIKKTWAQVPTASSIGMPSWFATFL